MTLFSNNKETTRILARAARNQAAHATEVEKLSALLKSHQALQQETPKPASIEQSSAQ